MNFALLSDLTLLVLYTVYGFLLMFIAALRRRRSNKEFFSTQDDVHYFRTSGDVVVLTALLSMGLYITLLVLLLR